MNYWRKTEIKYIQTRRKKIPPEDVKKICQLVADKTTGEISFRKIASSINKEFEETNRKENGKILSITHPTI